MSFTDMTRLRRRDLQLDGDTLVVTTRVRLAPDPETGNNADATIHRGMGGDPGVPRLVSGYPSAAPPPH